MLDSHQAPSAPRPLTLLQRRTIKGVPRGSDETRPEETDQREIRLVCRACGHHITDHAARIEIAGRHVHRRTNPSHVEFEFACFDAAPGSASVGDPTDEHSWFSGYRWQFAVCRKCGSHLGWYFRGREPAFWGLVTNRLVSIES
ncbi:MAG: cereblon family protein [Thermoanaerobaculia bacterium]|nr:cereblon family protein [Thermoanaerobaculia bacterium]